MTARRLALLILLFAAFTAAAQKLPKVQEAGLRAPANIKIDGKATEWSDKFQAFNPATSLFYTMANDDDNLYLAIKISELDAVNKFFIKGITLGFQKEAKKDDKNKVAIIFPLMNENQVTLVGMYNNSMHFTRDTTARGIDSVMRRNNAALGIGCKWLKVSGIEGLDTVSVYNDLGLKAAGLFNKDRMYTLEMAVPLKYLQAAINTQGKFSYQIIMNGSSYGYHEPKFSPGADEAFK